jgi:exodeoxyribonuclease VII large subunit
VRRRRLDTLQSRLLRRSPELDVERRINRLATLRQQMATAMLRSVSSATHRLNVDERALSAVSPLATLDRGYAIVTDAGGRVLRNSEQSTKGATIQARLARGRLTAIVSDIPGDGENEK